MKPVSYLSALLVGAGLLFQSVPAGAGTTNTFFAKLGERLRQLDIRGQAEAGAVGYESVRPQAELPTSPPGVLPEQAPSQTGKPVQLAQSSDAAFRVHQLEEQVRALTGKIEDMNFQMLQLQEQIRKMQEDNEFRFQELEDQGSLKRKNKVAGTGSNRLGKPQPSDSGSASGGTVSGGNDIGLTNRKSITDLLEGEGGIQLGAPPASLGTLTFDADGNLIDSNVGKPIDLTRPQGQSQVLPESETELFDLGYSYVQGGDYIQAEGTFRSFLVRYPNSKRSQEARFWLGESLFAEGDYEQSARVFLENHKAHPDAPLAAQNLLKLGVSLAGMNQRELACATLAEVPKKYPSMSNAVRKRVSVEQRAAKCKNG